MSRSKRIKEALPAGVTVEELPSSPAPLLLVVRCSDVVSVAEMEAIRQGVVGAFGGQPCPPVVVVHPRITIEAVLDPRTKP